MAVGGDWALAPSSGARLTAPQPFPKEHFRQRTVTFIGA